MTRIRIVFSVLAIVCMTQLTMAQEAKYQSIFIYNFTRYIKWPEPMMSGNFVIGVLGNSELYDELQKMAGMKKQTQGLDLVIEKYNSIDEIQKCHILFVADDRLHQLSSISEASVLNTTLLVTDSPGQAQKGSTINFVDVDGRIKFELNQSNAEKRNLKISGALVSLAIIV